MRTSETIVNLAKAMAEVTNTITNPFNSAANPFYKSKYAPLDDILNLIRPILAARGLSLIQSPVSDGEKIGVSALLLHDSGEFIEFEPYYLTLVKGTPQDAGGAITYARRYQLNAILGITGDDDDDGNKISGKEYADAKIAELKETPVKTLKCDKCKGDILAVGKRSPFQIASGTKKETGETLCLPCFKKLQNLQKIKADVAEITKPTTLGDL